MLLVSTFTFFGLSGIQNLSYFTDLLGDQRITINLNASEEENETSNNEEVKEAKEKDANKLGGRLMMSTSALQQLASKDRHSIPDPAFREVSTPPPEVL